MNEFEHAVRQVLSEEDAALVERLGADQTLHQQIRATFEGQLRWFNVVGWLAGFALFGVACFLTWRFVNAGGLQEMLLWGAAAALAFAGVALVKIWFWLELQKNAVVREVKRLEVLVAGLAAELTRR